MSGVEETQGHGLFTYHLLRAFNEPSGRGNLMQVFDYLKPKVSDAARRLSRSQTPVLSGVDAHQIVVKSAL